MGVVGPEASAVIDDNQVAIPALRPSRINHRAVVRRIHRLPGDGVIIQRGVALPKWLGNSHRRDRQDIHARADVDQVTGIEARRFATLPRFNLRAGIEPNDRLAPAGDD